MDLSNFRRDAYWNKVGSRTTTGTPNSHNGETWLGKVRRFKQLKRIKDIARDAASAFLSHPWSLLQDEEQFLVTRELINLAPRISRRPWPLTAAPEAEVPTLVKSLKQSKPLRLLKISKEVLDGPGKSIFKHNLNLILRNTNMLATSFLKIPCPGVWLPRVTRSLEVAVKDWLMTLSRKTGTVVMLHVQISSASSKSIADLAGNANKLGRTLDEV